MLPPIVIILLHLELFMAVAPRAPDEHPAYDGPLAERQVFDVDPLLSTNFEIYADTPELKAFEARLRLQPIYVRVPGEKYLVFGLKAWDDDRGHFGVVRANLLLTATEQPLGPWNPDAGEMLRWAFSVLDHYGLDYDPARQDWDKTRQELIDWYHRDSRAVDWRAVAERLRATGRPVPGDLFDQHR